ncbi:MAG: hypothetical protein WCC90_11290 [Methylocella sp.]
MSSQKQIATLSAQVEALAAINATLQRYLEAVVSKVSPVEAKELIKSERHRLREHEQLDAIKRNAMFDYLMQWVKHIKIEDFRDALLAAGSFADFAMKLGEISGDSMMTKRTLMVEDMAPAIQAINEARSVLGKEPFPVPGEEGEPTKPSSGRRTRPPLKAGVSD